MAKLLRQNVGGVDYTMAGCALTGVCASSASDFIKAVTLSDGDHLSDGMSVVVTFANGNTAGNAPVPITIYSSDQTNYYSDSGMTVPFTLAPSGCYDLEYSGSGNVYSYMSYPVIQVGGVSAPLCNAQGKKASGAVWLAGDKVTLLYNDNSFIVIPQAGDTLTATTASVTVYGKPLRTGSTVRIMFTADITGANTTSVLTLTYNGVNIPVKAGKNGALSNFVASEVSSGVYKYVQAYTTLELMFDGTQFVIIGNPVVLSSADYTVYADGIKRVDTVTQNDKNMVTSGGVYTELEKRNPVIIATIQNNTTNIKYVKISNILADLSWGDAVYLLEARAGELLLISVGHGDNAIVAPKAKRLLDVHTKILGIAYMNNSRNLYIKISAWSHELVLTRITSFRMIDPDLSTVQEITANEYNSATEVTIET